MTTEIKCVRLLSGEDLVAKVDDSDKNHVTLHNPIIIVQQPAQNKEDGRLNFGFVPWPFFADRSEVEKHGVKVARTAIVMTFAPIADIMSQYSAATGGLILPNKSGLILG